MINFDERDLRIELRLMERTHTAAFSLSLSLILSLFLGYL